MEGSFQVSGGIEQTDSSQEWNVTHSREMLRDCQALVNTHLSFVVNNSVRRMVEVKLTLSWGLPRSTIKKERQQGALWGFTKE